MTLPRSSIPSVAKYMSGLKIQDKTEKGLMVRIGTLIDAIIAAQRGSNNAGSNLDKKSLVDNQSTPPTVTGTTSDLFNGISVNLDAIAESNNLSNYEVQVDSDPNFSGPTTKNTFKTDMTFKGLTSETDYFVRARALTKDGVVSDWFGLDPVTTGASPGGNSSDIDGTTAGDQRAIGPFTFNNDAEDVFIVSNFGLRTNDGMNDFYLTDYMDSAPQERITLEGPDLSIAPITYAIEDVSTLRYWSLAFFGLIEPADSPSSHTFSVKTPNDELTTEPVVVVKF